MCIWALYFPKKWCIGVVDLGSGVRWVNETDETMAR